MNQLIMGLVQTHHVTHVIHQRVLDQRSFVFNQHSRHSSHIHTVLLYALFAQANKLAWISLVTGGNCARLNYT